MTAGLTTFYMFRMWFMTFTGQPRDAHVYEHAHEPPSLMTIPLAILAVMSIIVAWGWPLESAGRGTIALAALVAGVALAFAHRLSFRARTIARRPGRGYKHHG